MKPLFQKMGAVSAMILTGVFVFWLVELRLSPVTVPATAPVRLVPMLPRPVENAAVRQRIPLVAAVRPRAVTQWAGVSENMVFSRDGRLFAQATGSAIEVKRVKDWKPAFRFGGGGNFAFSPDFRQVATTDGAKVSVWRLRDRKLLHSLDGAQSIYWPLSFSPDGKQIAAIGLPEWLTSREGPTNGYPEPVPTELRIWQLGGAKTPHLQAAPGLDYDEGISIVWKNGAKPGQTDKWVATCPSGFGDSTRVAEHTLSVHVANRAIVARDVSTEELLSRISLPSKMGPIAVAPDATLFAGADAADPLVYIWRLPDGKLLDTITLKGARRAVGLAFSSDAEQLAVSESSSPANSGAPLKGVTTIYQLSATFAPNNRKPVK